MQRRSVLGAIGGLLAAGCDKVAGSPAGQALFDCADDWHRNAHRALTGHKAMAPEFDRAQISPDFRGNGSLTVDTPEYAAAASVGFPDWRLSVEGMVAHPLSLSLENIRRLPQRTQITRHDCVEGWSAIGEWTGPQLSLILQAAGVQPKARFVVFRCADNLRGGPYYESVDLNDAFHPQTIVAHQLNGEPLPVKNGAPLRMRIERQLGYKHAKYLTGIEVVHSLDNIGKGSGGYWEDEAGYQWYAGI